MQWNTNQFVHLHATFLFLLLHLDTPMTPIPSLPLPLPFPSLSLPIRMCFLYSPFPSIPTSLHTSFPSFTLPQTNVPPVPSQFPYTVLAFLSLCYYTHPPLSVPFHLFDLTHSYRRPFHPFPFSSIFLTYFSLSLLFSFKVKWVTLLILPIY